MRIICCGSRDFKDSSPIHEVMYTLRHHIFGLTIVHGDARGADKLCAAIATEFGLKIEPHPADWEQYGKSAGHIRNREMLDAGASRVIAFINKPLEESKGTLNMVQIAQAAGVPTWVIRS